MEHPSPAELSAEQFGVKLRKVTSESNVSSSSGGSVTSSGVNYRRSLPHGPPTRCENRLAQRRSAASALSHSSSNIYSKSEAASPRLSQVAVRQEAAEKQAIERRMKQAASNSTNSRSWEKKKPTVPSKPGYLRNHGGLMPKSSSCSAINPATNSRSTSVPPPTSSGANTNSSTAANRRSGSRLRRSGSVPPSDSVVVTVAEEGEGRTEDFLLSWYQDLVRKCSRFQPVLYNCLEQAKLTLRKQSESIIPTTTSAI